MLDPAAYLATPSQGGGGGDTPLYSNLKVDCSTSFGHYLNWNQFSNLPCFTRGAPFVWLALVPAYGECSKSITYDSPFLWG